MSDPNLSAELCSDVLSSSARIVATMGPASFDTLEKTLQYGTIRMNMAFYDSTVHTTWRERIERVRKNGGNRICIMLDAVGPRVKLGKLPADGINLVDGAEFTISTRKDIVADDTIVSTIFEELAKFVKPGEPILLAEGKFRLEVVKVEDGTEVRTKVIHGGLLKKRGINLPKTDLGVPALSDMDREHLTALLKGDTYIDMVALSFVRDTKDVQELRDFLKSLDRPDVRIMSKIETQPAVDNITEIAGISDALMVARGDLWSEVKDPWAMPRLTTAIIRAGNEKGIPVITATQVASSMVNSDIPSRAEVDELYFLMSQGTDCVMGSEEFAIGKYPAETISAFKQVARQIDEARKEETSRKLIEGVTHGPLGLKPSTSTNQYQRQAAINWADNSPRIAVVVTISNMGAAARAVYRQKPHKPLVIVTNNPQTARYLQLFQVWAVLVDYTDDTEPRLVCQMALSKLNLPKEKLPVDENPTALLISNRWLGPNCNILSVEELPYPK
eukprot:TRINITY_DN60848_c0_g1_i1.p1 TRINITY_DN60848_c0_g1~~TRINITY_DN60848_c0_g1_i1.p1  ORF type:complete len:502 (+),score=50.60 TRINITY_DN60848_c0_g1_i1:68-1573(+)